jgi:hypothetical protein
VDVLWQVRIGVAAIILVIVAALLWWWVPKWQMQSVTTGDPKDRADIEDNFRKTVGQALGGIAVLIDAGMAYYRTQQTLLENEDQARLSQQASHDLLISQQVAKGFEQLGSDKMVLRLGGIYVAWAALTQAATARRRHEEQTKADLQRRITESFPVFSVRTTFGWSSIGVGLGVSGASHPGPRSSREPS